MIAYTEQWRGISVTGSSLEGEGKGRVTTVGAVIMNSQLG